MAFSTRDGTPKLIQVEPEAHRKAKVAAMLAGRDMKTWVSEVIEDAAERLQRQMGISGSVGARIMSGSLSQEVVEKRPMKRGGAKAKKKTR